MMFNSDKADDWSKFVTSTLQIAPVVLYMLYIPLQPLEAALLVFRVQLLKRGEWVTDQCNTWGLSCFKILRSMKIWTWIVCFAAIPWMDLKIQLH